MSSHFLLFLIVGPIRAVATFAPFEIILPETHPVALVYPGGLPIFFIANKSHIVVHAIVRAIAAHHNPFLVELPTITASVH